MGRKENGKIHIGEKYINKQGLEFEIVDYFSCRNVTVRFSDSTIKEECRMDKIHLGQCPHPTFSALQNGKRTCIDKKIANHVGKKNTTHVGEKHTNKQGLEFEIIDWINYNNVTIRFSDGTVKEGCQYSNIKKGYCPNPNSKANYRGLYKKHKIENEYTNTQGIKFKIIKYINSRDVTVQFEDGTIKGKCRIDKIQSGICPHPKGRMRAQYLGNKFKTCQGLLLTVIDVEKTRNVTVQFEDGLIKTHCNIADIKNGQCTHPTLNTNQVGSYAEFLTKPRAFQKNGNSYYPCICQKCNYRDILTPQEMVEHRDKCNKK